MRIRRRIVSLEAKIAQIKASESSGGDTVLLRDLIDGLYLRFPATIKAHTAWINQASDDVAKHGDSPLIASAKQYPGSAAALTVWVVRHIPNDTAKTPKGAASLLKSALFAYESREHGEAMALQNTLRNGEYAERECARMWELTSWDEW